MRAAPSPARPAAATAYLPYTLEESAGTRLFCFHHAGGSASSFSGLQRALGPKVSVAPVQLPGRERRAAEPRFTEIGALVEELDRELAPYLEETPHAFLGHSMGAIVAYRLASRRVARGAVPPYRLVVGGYPPPHRPAPISWALELPDEELARFLVSVGGMSETILRYPAWMRPALAQIRDDLRVCESHRVPPPDWRLPVPIEVFAGADDPLMPPSAGEGWSQHTSAGSRVHVLPGGHFFPHERPAEFLVSLSSVLFPA
ncbi:thioesterase II family protein [Actinomadura rubrisoli]|uniref:Thioesterase n=1 Tax=Actinomadura rubrisoli TaxID=2530368 RepID=A0A4R5C7Y9_9ACTN|nr:alpha/beta fold hydrolase [Actinomadura rubrisoli]TDD94230.1 thioesterase [Actinomadura rubrisoli]